MENYSNTVTARVALLIDADNFSSHYVTELFNKAAVYGNVIVRKAYGVGMGVRKPEEADGVMTTGFKWKPEFLHRHAIEPVVRFPYVSGKNVSDIALVIDAMELMRFKTVDAVCIASNDSDFSLLAMKLRENGIKVYGFGDKDPSKSFIASCDEYTRLSLPEAADITGIKKIISDACDSLNSDDNGWINMAEVGTYIRRVTPAFSPEDYGFDKLKSLVKSIPDFEVEYNESTLTASIRKKSGNDGNVG